MARPLTTHEVPVEGGALHVGSWRGVRDDAPVILAIHGGTSSHLVWSVIVDELNGEATVIAPDFRGAAGSEHAGPPYGLRAHADDMRRVLDHFGVERAVVTGWSLGGFIAATAAVALGPRTVAAVLVDGGLPLPLPDGFDPIAMQDVLIEPAMKRYRKRLATREEHRAIWRAHPSLTDPSLWTPAVVAHFDDEVEPTDEGDLRWRVDLESLRTDVIDTLTGETRTAAMRIDAPMSFVWAERGLQNEPTGYYPLDAVRAFAAEHPLRIAEGHDLNHYTLMLSPAGAHLVADELRWALSTA
jgi:pimeloyl-ACP methyl ester carboxylesterase